MDQNMMEGINPFEQKPDIPNKLNAQQFALVEAAKLRAMTHKDKSGIVCGIPQFSYAILSLKFLSVPGLGGNGWMVDNKWRVYIDFHMLYHSVATIDDMAKMVLRAVSHLIRDHSKRFSLASDTMAAMISQTMEVDSDLFTDRSHYHGSYGMTPPNQDLYPVMAPPEIGLEYGQLAEDYYAVLSDEGGAGAGAGAGGDTEMKDDPQSVMAPGSANGMSENAQLEQLADNIESGLSEPAQDDVKRQVAEDIKSNQLPGDSSNRLNMWADDILADKGLSWDRVVQRQIRSAERSSVMRSRRSYARLSRRPPLDSRIVRPSYTGTRIHLGLILDTSGSMMHNGSKVLRVVDDAIKNRRFRVSVMTGDVQLNSLASDVLSTSNLEFIGGGGTDMGAFLVQSREMQRKMQFDHMAVVTDGFTPWPSDPQMPFPVTVIEVPSGSSISPRYGSELSCSVPSIYAHVKMAP